MKYLKKILFSMLLLFVGIITVNADATNLPLWKSYVGTVTDNSDGNSCKVYTAEDAVDVFLVENGTKCVVTGVKKVEYDAAGDTGGYSVMIQPTTATVTTGEVIYGSVTDSVNNTSDTTVLLSEIVELIYSPSSTSTMKVKKFALESELAAGATDYILKAGSTADALYVYGGYVGGNMASIKITFSESNQKLSYSITYDESKKDEFVLATYFTWYLIDYIMEASPNYDSAMTIVNDSDKMSKIQADFTSKYGQVLRTTNPQKIEVGVFAKGTINDDIVSLYEAATNPTQTQEPSDTPTEDEDDGKNPNTGAFVNIFAIIALISVGTVLVLGNKRKLFRI